jgi:hypothetical protein
MRLISAIVDNDAGAVVGLDIKFERKVPTGRTLATFIATSYPRWGVIRLARLHFLREFLRVKRGPNTR